MSKSRIIVAAVVVVAVAGLVSLWRGRVAPGSTTIARSDDARHPASAAARPAAAMRDDSAQSLTLLADPDQPGSMRLEGQVVDGDESPVPGAMVVLSTIPPREIKSEADGSFVFDKLLATRYSLIALAAAGSAGPVVVSLDARTQPVILRLRPTTSLEVTVVDGETNKPLTGASVELRQLAVLTASSDGAGKASFASIVPGPSTLVAWAPGYGKSFAPLEIAPQTRQSHAEIALMHGRGVDGRVETSEGVPVAGALVFFEHASTAARPLITPARDGVLSGPDGRFRFATLAVGTYRFVAQQADRAPGSSALITVDGRRDIRDVRVVLGPGAGISGRVVDREGKPVGGAVLRVAPEREGLRRVRQAAAREDGSFAIRGLARSRVDVWAQSPRATSQIVPVDLQTTSQKTDLVLTLDVDGTIAGVVVDSSGQPVPEAQVSAIVNPSLLNARAVDYRAPASDVADEGGRFKISGLADGEYLLRARRPGARATSDLLSQPGTTARAGDRDVRLLLQREGTIRGKVAFASGDPAPLFTAGTTISSPVPFSGGAFSLGDVPPGVVSLVIAGPSFETVVVPDIVVEQDHTKDVGTVTVKPGRTVSGRVLRDDGTPVAGAHVLAGYRLVGDGDRLTTQAWGAPGGAGATRETTSDERGVYALRGMGGRDLALMADHTQLGRSITVRVPASDQSSVVDLVIAPLGSIEGSVTRGGKPAEGVNVNASPKSMALSSNLVVSTGPDGRYRFSRVASDDYVVSAMSGLSPLSGMTMKGVTVTVAPGMTAEADLTLSDSPVTLTVSPLLPTQQVVPLAEVVVVAGEHTFPSAQQLHQYVAAQAGAFNSFNLIINATPTRVRNLDPGTYSACVIPFPQGMEKQTTAVVMQYVEKHLDGLRVFCRSTRLTDEAEQSLTVPVVQPPPVGNAG